MPQTPLWIARSGGVLEVKALAHFESSMRDEPAHSTHCSWRLCELMPHIIQSQSRDVSLAAMRLELGSCTTLTSGGGWYLHFEVSGARPASTRVSISKPSCEHQEKCVSACTLALLLNDKRQVPQGLSEDSPPEEMQYRQVALAGHFNTSDSSGAEGWISSGGGADADQGWGKHRR